MSLPDTLTLDGATGTEVVFALQGRDNQGSRRIDNASTLTEPRLLVIKHSKTGVGANAIDRHLIQLSRTELDTATIPRTAIVNLTIAVPQTAAFTQPEINDMVGYLVDLITDGGFSDTGFAGVVALGQLLRSES